MINTKTLCLISKVMSKLDITKEIMKVSENGSPEEVGKEIIALLINNLYKAEEDIVNLLASYKNVSKEEAEKLNVIEEIKELLKDEKIRSFLNLM